jgi:hypothetical protein
MTALLLAAALLGCAPATHTPSHVNSAHALIGFPPIDTWGYAAYCYGFWPSYGFNAWTPPLYATAPRDAYTHRNYAHHYTVRHYTPARASVPKGTASHKTWRH